MSDEEKKSTLKTVIDLCDRAFPTEINDDSRPICRKYQSQGAQTDVIAKDKDGRTALYLAAQHGHVEVVKVLLAKGAEVNMRGKDYDHALQVAAIGRHEEVVRFCSQRVRTSIQRH